MVRRAAAFRLGKLAETMEPDMISKELIPLFQDLTQDGERCTQVYQTELRGKTRSWVLAHSLPRS